MWGRPMSLKLVARMWPGGGVNVPIQAVNYKVGTAEMLGRAEVIPNFGEFFRASDAVSFTLA